MCFYLKGRLKEVERERDLHLLVHSQIRSTLVARSGLLLTWEPGAAGLRVALGHLPRPLAGSCVANEAARTQTSDHMRCHNLPWRIPVP